MSPRLAASSRAVLVTGSGTGIGHATAAHLAARGWPVYATVHHLGSFDELHTCGARVRQLDVRDEASMRAVVTEIEREHGAVGVLVNNAGYGLQGAVERLDLDEVRQQLETNLLGPTRLTQLVLPGMRRQRWGRIVNVSSVGGRLTTPGAGAYHASKHALEALSDALRFEVAGFGVDVVVVEPGAIRSRWLDKVVAGMQGRARDPASPYARFDAAVVRELRGAHEGLLALAAASPEAVARVIERAITAPRPRTRYVVPRLARVFVESRRWLPDRLWDAFLRTRYPSPGADEPARGDES